MSWGYGASGTFGFKTPGICDRYHDGARSDYFDENFVKKYWVNFVWNGDVEASHYEKGMTEYPWWVPILASRPFWIPWLGWLLAALLLFLTWTLLPGPTSRNTGSTSKPITADLQAAVLAVQQEAQEARRNADDEYQRISTVLNNSESTLPQQIACLDELPDAMCVVIPRAVVSQVTPVG